jgi:glycosyltransferase involved in cell wall biosynthesis/O-antigen/teichoic acid export membrane protein
MSDARNLVVMQRIWQGGSGVVTLLLLTHYLNPTMQGWYYGFLSLAALYVVFDHGLSQVLIQRAAHAIPAGNIKRHHSLTQKEQATLEQLCTQSFRQYSKVALGFFTVIVLFGIHFFGKAEIPVFSWQAPWIALTVATSLTLLVYPFLSIIEGGGQVKEVYKVRLIQSVTGSILCWIGLANGLHLWATVALPAAMVCVQLPWLWMKWRHLLRNVLKPSVKAFSWNNEVWPLEWRVALSFISTYLFTQILTLILFQSHGAELAGKMGLSLAIVNMIALLASSSLTANTPKLTQLATLKNWIDMDKTFIESVRFSIIVYISISVIVLSILYNSDFWHISDRMLSFPTLTVLFFSILLSQFNNAIVIQLRSYQQEPLLWVSVMGSGMMLLATYWIVPLYGAWGIVVSLLTIQASVILPLSILICFRNNRFHRSVTQDMVSSAQLSKHADQDQESSVAILMGTYQGEKYLSEQLESISAQTFSHWKLYVSDDGSTDGTMDILKAYSQKHEGKVSISQNETNLGFAKNFMLLIQNESINDDYYAIADQDDIWLPDKLKRALTLLTAETPKRPSLYFGRTRLINADGKHISYSPLFTIPPSFSNALVQSMAGGNTYFFNRATQNQLIKTTNDSAFLVSHDWWIYLVVSGCGGNVIYDRVPTILYRQHNKNLVGENKSMTRKIDRFYRLFSGHFKRWLDSNIEALEALEPFLTPENSIRFNAFKTVRTGTLPERLKAYRKAGIHREKLIHNIVLMIAVILKKI